MKFQIMWKEAVVQKASSKGTQIKYYTDEVAEKLETIVNTAKKLKQGILFLCLWYLTIITISV